MSQTWKNAIDFNVFPHKLMRFPRKEGATRPYYTSELQFPDK